MGWWTDRGSCGSAGRWGSSIAATLPIVLPIFALILVGFGVRRAGIFGAHATAELNRFVVMLALPALLLDVTAHATWATFDQPGFVVVYGGSSLLVFGLGVWLRRRRGLADAALDGLDAGYANAGFIGFPLCLAVFGPASLAPTTIGMILTVCVLFAVGIVVIELGLQVDARPGRLAALVVGRLARNPLVMAPVLGGMLAALGVGLPVGVVGFLKLLGDAAAPCALIALGLFLAERRSGARDGRAVLLFVAMKLFLHPAVAWGLAWLVGLPPLLGHIAVVLAALPTGTGPFMLAEYYRREAGVTARAILLSTILSVFTVSAYLAWIS